jgi:hypothetical protein
MRLTKTQLKVLRNGEPRTRYTTGELPEEVAQESRKLTVKPLKRGSDWSSRYPEVRNNFETDISKGVIITNVSLKHRG